MSEKLEQSHENPETEKQAYREVMGVPEGQDPDLILVLDAGISQRKVLGETRFGPTSYEDETGNFPEKIDPNAPRYALRKSSRENFVVGSGGGKARALAARNLAEIFQGAEIVTDSKYPVKSPGQDIEVPENHSEIYKEYLEGIGVDSDKIIQEDESTITFEGLINFLTMAADSESECPIIITNEYHLPRTQRMIEFLLNEEKAKEKFKYLIEKLPDGLKKKMEEQNFFDKIKGLSVKVVTAESILAHNNPHYENLFAKARETEAYKKRIEMEQEGVRQLDEGTYGKPK